MDAKRWPIDRTWQVDVNGKVSAIVSTAELAIHPVLALVGAAGMGKTTELDELQRLEAGAGQNVRACRLARLSISAEALQRGLRSLVRSAKPGTTLYLDALDEAAVLLPMCPLVLTEFLAEIVKKRIRVRISCRTAVWPTAVQGAMNELAATFSGADEPPYVPVAHLQPLGEVQIASAAAATGIDAKVFVQAVRKAKAMALASNPVTLKMLIARFQSKGSLPTSRRDLFKEGIAALAHEREERKEIGTDEKVDAHLILGAAEVLACCAVVSGRELVSSAHEAADGTISVAEFADYASQLPVAESVLTALRKSGLCDSVSPKTFSFAHRQIAEYLAGRRIAALPLHQAKSLLCTSLGWQKGVAGPLRETAAFAAMHSKDIAEWIAEYDPEVIGLSDVADDNLRRQATHRLLERFRRHELTDAVLYRGTLPLEPFQYPNPEDDLKPVLAERGADAVDVLECAVALIRTWRLHSMSDELATLMLDPAAPLEVRRAAGRALAEFGTDSARARVSALIYGGLADPDEDLKGEALRCNWGHGLTTKELFAVLTIPVQPLSYGSYASFLSHLNNSGFDGGNDPLLALGWALTRLAELQARHHRSGAIYEIIQRVAAAALQHVGKSAVAKALAALVLQAADYSGKEIFDTEDGTPPLLSDTSKRRALLLALAEQPPKKTHTWWSIHETPALLGTRDFRWLLERATDTTIPADVRRQFAQMAWVTDWQKDSDCVDAWVTVLDQEPVKSVFNIPRFIRLKSREAARLRMSYREHHRPRRKPEKLTPSPTERVANALALCETKDPEFFRNVINELSLKEDSTHYDHFRHLTDSPGWANGDAKTRERIVEAAVRFMEHPTSLPTTIRSEPMNSIFIGHMEALLLIQEQRPAWLSKQNAAWWRRWSWFIMRELHIGLSDEVRKPKERLFAHLLKKARAEVRREIVSVASTTTAGAEHFLGDLLRLMESVSDADLDRLLCGAISSKKVPEDRVRSVAQFVLSRSPDVAVPVCINALDPTAPPDQPSATAHLLTALLSEQTARCWMEVTSFFVGRPGIARQALAAELHQRRLNREDDNAAASSGIASLSLAQKVQLVSLLFDLFPPESDPPRVGSRAIGPSDSARDTRDRLINWLGQQKSHEAVRAWQDLFARYGSRYPWLRRPKAAVERAYRTDNWNPVGTATVAALLVAGDRRLVRSAQDAVDGIVEALAGYQSRLNHGDTGALVDVWNIPKKGLPSPKDEGHLSTKIAEAIRAYFANHSVSADREVEIWRRRVSPLHGGTPSDEVDVLYRVAGPGTVTGSAITVAIEVKLSHNPEARTGLKAQLVDRYMTHLNAEAGVFVVVHMAAAHMAHRPLWKSAVAVRRDLDAQAADVGAASAQSRSVTPIVIDASVGEPRPKGRGKRARKRDKPHTPKRKPAMPHRKRG